MALPDRPAPPLWLLVLITISGTLAMHIFVPALPAVARALHSSVAATQLTISLYLVGLAVGQLGYGVLADRFGRRPVLFAGLGIYGLASVAAAVAPSIEALLAARLLQALGGCAGLALGRAIVRDLAAPEAAASRLAILNLVVSVGPGVAPIIGGALSIWFGWRSIFVLLAVVAAVTLAAAARLLPETRQAMMPRDFVGVLRDYGRLLGSPVFMGYAVGGACATTSMYGFMAASPLIYGMQLHRPAGQLGLYYGLLVIGIAVGNLVASRLVGRVGIARLMLIGSALGVAGAVGLLGVVLADMVVGGTMTVVTVTVPVMAFTVGAGVASPMALTRSVGVNPLAIASAAGLYGFGQMALGALCTAASGLGGNPALAAAIVLVVTSVLGLAAFGLAQRLDR